MRINMWGVIVKYVVLNVIVSFVVVYDIVRYCYECFCKFCCWWCFLCSLSSDCGGFILL